MTADPEDKLVILTMDFADAMRNGAFGSQRQQRGSLPIFFASSMAFCRRLLGGMRSPSRRAIVISPAKTPCNLLLNMPIATKAAPRTLPSSSLKWGLKQCPALSRNLLWYL
jgi:hypothetical protein